MLKTFPLVANTGADPIEIPYTGGEAFFSIKGDFSGGTASLVVAQRPTDGSDPVFGPGNFTELTSDGGYPINLGPNHIVAVAFVDGGGSIDLEYALDPMKINSKEVI